MPLLNTAKALYAGSIPAQRVYLGSSLVWEAVWTPKSIPGLTLWIDAKQQVDSDGARVTVVKDWSGNNRTGVMTAGQEPIYRTNFYGQPCFEWMSGSAAGVNYGQWNAGTVGLTYLFAGRITGGTYPMMVVHGTDGDGIEMRHNGKQEIVLRYTSHGIVYTHEEPSGGEKDHMWSLRVDRTQSVAWTNRVAKTGNPTATMYNTNQALYVGRRELGYPFIGAMREVLVYAGALSDADMTKLFDYLQPKWTLT